MAYFYKMQIFGFDSQDSSSQMILIGLNDILFFHNRTQ